MPRRLSNGDPRPGQIGSYWLSKKPGRQTNKDAWCRTWYDPGTRQTSRVSLGTADFQAASLKLANWVVANDKGDNATGPDRVLIESILLTYWLEHAQKLPSALTAWNGLAYWQEFWHGRTISAITPQEQRRFRKWLSDKNIGDGGIDRILSDGRAALNRAVKWQELSEAPHIFGIQTAEDKTITRTERSTDRPDGVGAPIRCSEISPCTAVPRHSLQYTGSARCDSRSARTAIR